MSYTTPNPKETPMNDYPCCECCLTDPLHPDHHEVSCPTCNNPTADRLRAELAHMREARDNARAEVERLTVQIEAAKRICLGTHLGRTWPSVLNDVLRALAEGADRD